MAIVARNSSLSLRTAAAYTTSRAPPDTNMPLVEKDSVIEALGNLDELKLKYLEAEMVNLNGKTPMPAFMGVAGYYLR